jgi:hypothetical protein
MKENHMMSPIDTIIHLFIWSLIGAALFSVFVVFVFRSGIVYTSRNEDGKLKDKIPIKGYITMALFLLAIVGFFVLANYFGLGRDETSLGFLTLFLLNLGLYLLLFLFDTIFIDWFVLIIWRPKFLHLSDQLGSESMHEHITKSIPVGMAFGIAIAGLSSVISFLAFIN